MSNKNQTNTIDISNLFDCQQEKDANGSVQPNARISTARLYFEISTVY